MDSPPTRALEKLPSLLIINETLPARIMFKNKSSKAAKIAKEQPVFKQHYFNNCHRTYSCIHCRAHLANHDELISKLFQGNHGRAYLFNKVVNIGTKHPVQRELLTGLHAVADIYCDNCETTLGWKYERAFVPSQKYKEGKYIIELAHMLKENDWDPTSYNARELLVESSLSSSAKRNNHTRGIDSRRVGNFFVGLNNFNLDDKNNGPLRKMSLEYQLNRGVAGPIDIQIDANQESSEVIIVQQKQVPLQPSSPTATFDIRLLDSEKNEEPQVEERPQQEVVEVIEELDSMDSSQSQIVKYEYHSSNSQDLPVSPQDSLSSRDQSHYSSPANSVTDDRAADEENADEQSNERHNNFKIIKLGGLSEKCSNQIDQENVRNSSNRFDLILDSVEPSAGAS